MHKILVDVAEGGSGSDQERAKKKRFHSLLPMLLLIKNHFKKSCPLKPNMNIFVPFSVHPYDVFKICEEGNNIWSWIIEYLLIHENVDVDVLLSDQGIFLLCF
jgi:hypothetical protein